MLDNRYKEILLCGSEYIKENNLREAANVFNKAHELRPYALPPLHNLGNIYAKLRDYEQSISFYKKGLSFSENNISMRRRLSEVLVLSGKLGEALEESLIIRKITNCKHERDAVQLSNIYSLMGMEVESERVLIDYAEKEALHLDETKPLILVAALPKSASTSISYTLADAISSTVVEYPCKRDGLLFNATNLVKEIFSRKLCKGKIIHSHTTAEQANLNIINESELKLVIHVRDPRDCLLSAHQMILKGQGPQFLLREPDFFGWDETKQIDWLIDNYLPFQIKWINHWLSSTDELNVPFFISTFEQIVENGMTPLISKIADALNIHMKPNYKEHTRRFREGKVGSWKTIFNKQQVEKANRHIPDILKEHFKWD